MRNGVVSLSLTPKDVLMTNLQKNWDSIYYAFRNTSYWKNSANSTVDKSMYNQFACHFDFYDVGDTGPTWDLESETPDKGYYGFVLSKCN